MDGVRRNIALKLKEPTGGSSPGPPAPTSSPPTTATTTTTSSSSSSSSSSTHTQSVTTETTPTNIITKGFPLHLGKELRWDYRLNLIGRSTINPLLHMCEVCDLPILIYGRMKRCRHAFCRDCAKKAGGECPRCHEADQTFEEATMGNVFVCSNGGERYNNKGCGRSYLSQRDLDAHIAYRHTDKSAPPATKIIPFFPPPPPPPAPPTGELAGKGSTLAPTFPLGTVVGSMPPPPPPPSFVIPSSLTAQPSQVFTTPTTAPNWTTRPPGFN